MEKYKSYIATNDKVEMVHISLERGANTEKALSWAVKEKFPWLTVMPGKLKDTVFRDTQYKYVPTYILVDKDGKELVRGQDQVFEMINSLK